MMGGIRRIILVAILALGVASTTRAEEITLRKIGGVYEVPVQINGVLNFHFIIDTGAAEVFIPADLVDDLKKTKTLTREDVLPYKVYTLADGSTVKSPRVVLRSLKIGSIEVENIQASVSQPGSPLLLGQSLLEKLGSYTVDNQRRVLVVEGKIPGVDPRFVDLTDRTDVDPTETYSLKTPTGAIQSFYRSVDQQRFDMTWASLSSYSQNEFVSRVSKVTELDPEKVRQMFSENHQKLIDSFWASFRRSSKIPEFIPEATFRLVREEDGVAVVQVVTGGRIIDSIAYQEGNEWRMGYIETFFTDSKKKK